MKFKVRGVQIHASTGGRKHDRNKPWIVFLHGAGSSHLTWLLQSRALAYDGYNVLAPDLPGHNLSGGEAIEGIADQANWVLAAMDSVDCPRAVFVGHSMGGLMMLELAAQAPDRVDAAAFVSTAAAIPVNPQLIKTASKDEEQAFASMMAWAHGPDAHKHEHSWPGGSHLFFGIDMMRLNAPGTLAVDLRSCADYADGLERAASFDRPSICVFGRLDRMTPIKMGLQLADALPQNETFILEGAGHTLPSERPREVNSHLRRFLAEVADTFVA